MNKDKIQAIKKECHLLMNGVVSTQMRNCGVAYRVNFGLTLPLIHQIAQKYTPEVELADQLWQEGVRECRILATLLHPVAEFTPTKAAQWLDTAGNNELADQCCTHLFCHLNEAPQLAIEWIQHPDTIHAYAGYQLLNRVVTKGFKPNDSEVEVLAKELQQSANAGSALVKMAAVNAALKLVERAPDTIQGILQRMEQQEATMSCEAKQLYQLLVEEKAFML